MASEDDEYRREILENLHVSARIFYGKYGVAVLVCAIVVMVGINCFARFVPPPNIGGRGHDLLPAEYAPRLPLSIAAFVMVCGGFMGFAFIAILCRIHPPAENARNYFLPIVVVVLIGAASAWFHAPRKPPQGRPERSTSRVGILWNTGGTPCHAFATSKR